MAACLMACGIDHKKCIFFQQSDVQEHTELSWILGTFCSLGKLHLLPQWKEKSKELTDVGSGLLTYPILQSADILLYKGTHVPVGDDQVKHVELTGYLGRIFNNRYGTYFPKPMCLVTEAKRIKSLRDPKVKMSKSDRNKKSCIKLTDSPDEIFEKIKKAQTDFISTVTYDPETRPGVSNLLDIHSAFTGKTPEEICEENCLVDTGAYKKILADVVIAKLRPIREQYLRLKSDCRYVEDVLKTGADKARSIAEKTSKEVKELIGLK
ncbi:tryptophan--tRNA ligase, mitochondrial-like [Lineus longissimus]|uniref:tryptophan--tRNA ligase, mitochondrial-like n=1 Tax=Lineus longissimus TaxID=88925 RepID=UPI00315C73B4